MEQRFAVLARPTDDEVAQALAEGSGTLRAIRDAHSGDLYVWDAELMLLEQAIRHLGLGDHAENLGQLYSVSDFRRLR